MKITDYGYNGEGVGHENGKVCFVPYTLIDEEVEIEPQKETSTFIKAFPKKIILPSQNRTAPPCAYFTICGGCDFQHMSYESEISLKKEILFKQLKKISFDKDFDVVKSNMEYGYRNKIKFFCGSKGLSLKRAMSDTLVPIDKCMLARDEINAIICSLNSFILKNNLTKLINTVTLRSIGEFSLVKLDFLKLHNVDFTGLSLLLGDKVYIYTSVNGDFRQRVFGRTLEIKENDLIYDFDVDAFRQVNDSVAKKMYYKVCEAVKGGKVLNAYSGAGVLSGLLSQNSQEVYGVELGESEHASAETLKEKNKLTNLTNINGDCKEVISKLDVDFDYIVLDPPRSGCAKEVCEEINKQNCQIIYISCNPATLVRDIQRLDTFTTDSVTLFDMFPRTANFEVMAILKKNID